MTVLMRLAAGISEGTSFRLEMSRSELKHIPCTVRFCRSCHFFFKTVFQIVILFLCSVTTMMMTTMMIVVVACDMVSDNDGDCGDEKNGDNGGGGGSDGHDDDDDDKLSFLSICGKRTRDSILRVICKVRLLCKLHHVEWTILILIWLARQLWLSLYTGELLRKESRSWMTTAHDAGHQARFFFVPGVFKKKKQKDETKTRSC